MEQIKFLLDFAQGGNLKDTIKDLKEVKAVYDSIAKQTVALKTQLSNTNDSKEIISILPQIEKLKAGYKGVGEEIDKVNKKKKESKEITDQELEQQIRATNALNERKKAVRELIKDETALQLAAKKQVNSIKDLREQTNALVRLRDKQNTSTKEGAKLFEQYTQTIAKNEATLKQYDSQIGRSQRNVGNYKSALEGASATFKSLGNQILRVAGITGGIMFFQNAIKQIAEFDQSLADLRAILGLTADSPEFKFLSEQALVLGETTTASAAEVVEAYKLIASAKPELLQNVNALNEVTKATITLSEASGLDLPTAAVALTDALNQFGAGADEAARFMNVLAAGAKFGSAEIPEVTEALVKFGVAAKSSNVNIEESTALIELFAEKGIKGAEAGTALRNILLKLSTAKSLPPKATAELAKAGVNTSILADNSLKLEVRLRELSKIQNNATAIVKTFGTENAVQAQALLQNIDRFKQLNEQVTGTTAATDAAAERTDTLSGEMKKLANAWQVAMLRFAEGGGSLKNVVRFIRENLDTILDIVGKVVKAFIVYKATLATVNAAYKVADVVKYAQGLFKVKDGLVAAEVAQKGLNKAMAANVIGIVVTGLFSLIDAFGGFKTAADLAAESQERINAAIAKADSYRDVAASIYEKRTEALQKAYENERKLIESSVAGDAKAQEDKNKALAELELKYANARQSDIVNQLQNQTNARKVHAERELKLEAAIAKLKNEIQNRFVLDNNFVQEEIDRRRLEKLTEALAEEQDGRRKAIDKIDELNQKQKDLEVGNQVAINEAIQEENDKKNELTKKQIDEAKRLREEEYQKRLAEIERNRILEETAIIRGNNDEKDRIKLREQLNVEYLTSKMMLEIEFNKEFVKTEQERTIAFDNIRKRELEEEKKNLEIQLDIYKELDALETRNIQDEFDKRKVQEMQNFEEKLATLKEQGKLTAELEAGLTKELNDKLSEIEKERTKKKLEDEIDEYEEYYKERELLDYQNGLSQEEIDKNNHERKIEMLKDEIRLREEANEDTLELRLELAREEKAIDEKRKADNKELTEQILKDTTDSIKVIINAYQEAFNQKLEQDKTAIENQKRNVELQQSLAERGLENTLAEEKRIQAEKEKQLLIDQKKQQKLKEVETFFNLLASYSKTNPDTAAAKAFATLQISKAIAAKLEDGGVISDVVAEQNRGILKGASHKNGGILIEAEGEEGIFSKKEMRNLGKDNFYAIKDSLKQGSFKNFGMKNQNESMIALVQTKQQPARADLTPLLSKMDNLQKAIEEKPVPSMHIDKNGNLITRYQTSTMIRTIVHKNNRPKGFNN